MKNGSRGMTSARPQGPVSHRPNGSGDSEESNNTNVTGSIIEHYLNSHAGDAGDVDEGDEEEGEAEAPVCNNPDCFHCHNDPESSPILQLVCRSAMLDSARRQTRQHPSAPEDISIIWLPLAPREPMTGIQTARMEFEQVIADMANGFSVVDEIREQGRAAAVAAAARLLLTFKDGLDIFVSLLLRHCDREMFLRRFLRLPQQEEGSHVNMQRQTVLILELENWIRDDVGVR
jgi:hypothetical protein